MSNERDKEEMDELVSNTYRELTDPRTPDHLNQRILRMAAGKNRGNDRLRFAGWMKPVAWAATIALSLAIVLEMSELPTTPGQMDVLPAESHKVESKAKSVAPQDAVELEQAVNRVRSQTEPDKQLTDDDELSEPAEGLLEELVPEYKGRADTFAASPPATARPVASFALTMEKKEGDAAPACDLKARQSADNWLECIDNLRKSGLDLDADREYEAYILEYPAESVDSESNK